MSTFTKEVLLSIFVIAFDITYQGQPSCSCTVFATTYQQNLEASFFSWMNLYKEVVELKQNHQFVFDLQFQDQNISNFAVFSTALKRPYLKNNVRNTCMRSQGTLRVQFKLQPDHRCPWSSFSRSNISNLNVLMQLQSDWTHYYKLCMAFMCMQAKNLDCKIQDKCLTS